MNMPPRASAVRQLDGQTALTFPYDRALVEDLKLFVPASERRWDPPRKTWYVTRLYTDQAITLVRRVYPDLEVIHERRWQDDRPPLWDRVRGTNPYTSLHLLPTAPLEVVEVVYRCLARAHHPDVGGDTERMKQLNLAYEALRARSAS